MTATDLVVPVFNLPEMDGLDVCRHLCATFNPRIIMLSARMTMTECLLDLELGADDPITHS